MSGSPTLALCKELIERASITPDDAGCQDLIAERLVPLGFAAEKMQFEDVSNIWLRKGTRSPLFVFLGHTDVVPTGPVSQWSSPPFTPTVREGFLYGRGAADMKSGIAAFVTACERFLNHRPEPNGSIALLLTSDEEGPAINGTVKVIERLQHRGENIDYCLVGEPSSEQTLGDIIKNGRRGSLLGTLRVKGKQGHVAYPHLADNPIHKALPALSELCATRWDEGNQYFPATSFQISNINSGTGAVNVIPGHADVLFNWRFSSELSAEQIQARCEEILDKNNLDYEIKWRLSGHPFITPAGELIHKVCQCVQEVVDSPPQLSTGGGTSDGRFVAPTGAQVFELGVVNQTIHKVDECVEVSSLDQLTLIYERILETVL
ncbi:MAG: succinyl-diaminopimelate desuccinylase [Candidatus Obscuribacterales bacterium]|nr:succinyl-diaminopimelate desuccinylase [Candidatus Obscuribacterales bacterium]